MNKLMIFNNYIKNQCIIILNKSLKIISILKITNNK